VDAVAIRTVLLQTYTDISCVVIRLFCACSDESGHITNCLLVLIFFCAIIVPLDLYVHNQPESAVLLQGLGQAFLVTTMTSIIFAPKMYIVLTTDAAGQKVMMSATGARGHSQGTAPTTAAGGQSNTHMHRASVRPSTFAKGGVSNSPRPLPVARAPAPSRIITTSQHSQQPPSAMILPSAALQHQLHQLDHERIDEAGESAASSLAESSQFDGVELAAISLDASNLLSRDYASSSTPPPEVNETPSRAFAAQQQQASDASSTPAADSALWRTKNRMSLVLATLSPVPMRSSPVSPDRGSPSPPPPPSANYEGDMKL
jgi:hypothetical protein